MRNITLPLLALLCVTACERVPIFEARIEGEGVTPDTEYLRPGEPPRLWTIEDDWHRLLMAVRFEPERLSFFVATRAKPSKTTPGIKGWEATHLLKVGVSTDCSSETQYFDNPANSFANNFLKARYPEVYAHSPETGEPDLVAIMTIENCMHPEFGLLITVIDDLGEPARLHRLKIRTEQVDWHYSLLFPWPRLH